MKIFGIEIRKFKEEAETIEVVETWNVRWLKAEKCIFLDHSADLKELVQGFPSKESAEAYAKELIDARRLLGDKMPKPSVEKMVIPTNV